MTEEQAPAPPQSAEPSATATATAENKINRLTVQIKKLTEANAKYKNLLKLAKERIQQAEEELERGRAEKAELEKQLRSEEQEASQHIALEVTNAAPAEETNIVQVCQCVKVPVTRRGDDNAEEIYALIEMEVASGQEMMPDTPPKRFKQWKQFDTESQLQDFIRRDTGEPLVIPPYSLTPDQSARIQQEAAHKASLVTEEFRRFRVRSELSRKQAEAQIRDLQSNQVQTVAKRIEGQQDRQSLAEKQGGSQVERLKSELAAQEAHWKEAYDTLLAENSALKSSGSEALLAAQWRNRYEACLKEKESLQQEIAEKAEAGKYEMKYRDLKESFRLYRKKAKEVFESQQPNGAGGEITTPPMWSLGDTPQTSASTDAKLSYLKNLMLNYLSSDAAVREHMEGAIETVLEFSESERAFIEKKKEEHGAWF